MGTLEDAMICGLDSSKGKDSSVPNDVRAVFAALLMKSRLRVAFTTCFVAMANDTLHFAGSIDHLTERSFLPDEHKTFHPDTTVANLFEVLL